MAMELRMATNQKAEIFNRCTARKTGGGEKVLTKTVDDVHLQDLIQKNKEGVPSAHSLFYIHPSQ
jgi:hypothetical protein